MPQVCILTDSTAQFPAPAFPGHELVSVIPLRVILGQGMKAEAGEVKTSQLPTSIGNTSRPQLVIPSPEAFQQSFNTLGNRFQEIVAILSSSHLSQVVANAQKAASGGKHGATVHVVDSQSCAVGLGLLVQSAAEASLQGHSGAAISRMVRSLVPHIYTAFCVEGLTYLAASKLIDPAQAVVGEMLGVMPLIALENGKLVAIQKVRSVRHLVDLLHEFITEFDDIRHVALLQGWPPFKQEAHNLRDRINGHIPARAISEHSLGSALASLIGPRSLGIVVMENCSKEMIL